MPKKGDHLGGQIVGGDFDSFDPRVWSWIVNKMKIRSVISVGCGQGYEINYFKNVLGCEVLGVDGDAGALKGGLLPNNVVLHDYVDGPYVPRKEYDLVLSYEFVEHVEEKCKENFLKTFLSAGSYIVMTHAVPGQGGWHHVNCQPDEYWIEEIEKLGFKYEPFITRFVRSVGGNHLSKSGLVFSKNKKNQSRIFTTADKVSMFVSIVFMPPVKSFVRFINHVVLKTGWSIEEISYFLWAYSPRLYRALKKFYSI